MALKDYSANNIVVEIVEIRASMKGTDYGAS